MWQINYFRLPSPIPQPLHQGQGGAAKKAPACGSSGKYAAQNLNRPEKCEIGHHPNLLHQKHENPLERDRNSPDQTFCAGLIQICSCWMGLPDMFQPTNNSIFTKTEQILGTIILQLVFRSQRRLFVFWRKKIMFLYLWGSVCVTGQGTDWETYWLSRASIPDKTTQNNPIPEHRYLTVGNNPLPCQRFFPSLLISPFHKDTIISKNIIMP